MAIAGLVKEINNIINKIKQKFKISKCEPINYILGIKIEKNNFNYSISQKHFINTILNKFNINNMKKLQLHALVIILFLRIMIHMIKQHIKALLVC